MCCELLPVTETEYLSDHRIITQQQLTFIDQFPKSNFYKRVEVAD